MMITKLHFHHALIRDNVQQEMLKQIISHKGNAAEIFEIQFMPLNRNGYKRSFDRASFRLAYDAVALYARTFTT